MFSFCVLIGIFKVVNKHQTLHVYLSYVQTQTKHLVLYTTYQSKCNEYALMYVLNPRLSIMDLFKAGVQLLVPPTNI